jgi:hypothetical protein
MKKKGKHFGRVPYYKKNVSPKAHEGYSKPRKQFKLIKYLFIIIISLLCLTSIYIHVEHFFVDHLFSHK